MSTCTNRRSGATRSISAADSSGLCIGITMEARRRGSRSSHSAAIQSLIARHSAAERSSPKMTCAPCRQFRMAYWVPTLSSSCDWSSARSVPGLPFAGRQSGRALSGEPGGAGMVTLGKLSCDEFAMGSANENVAVPAVGATQATPVRNPWDAARIPGGSSGGSAAAVAARLAPAATGTDTGGSIRQPASFCGVTGIKPTYGRASRYGMVAFASSLDQAGPMARSAEDCALLLSAMCGPDPDRDSTSLDRPAENFARDLNGSLEGLRIGVPKEFLGEGVAPGVRAAIDAALKEYEKLGAKRVEVSLPRTELSIPVYYICAAAESSSNLSRFDGVKFGHRAAQYKDLADMYAKTREEGFGDEVKRRIMIGTYVLSHGYYDAYYLQAQKVRRMIADDFQNAFKDCDIIAGPAAPTVAWKIGEHGDDPVADYLADIFTLPGSLAGLPGMSVPAGFDAGLPVGLQLIGNYFAEARLLNAAHRFQQATDWHLRAPAGF
ncbi:MAG: Asp-tRNA(Asn)/Glu-tRNA(Gln) amidotransferase subunit GatA [Rhodospirillales bacterium]|nr:Asp-tRNA(Asn)/Glu-tRNA(Gln) amidotransferase subunit GatA [Rhodospirillales bacterium]